MIEYINICLGTLPYLQHSKNLQEDKLLPYHAECNCVITFQIYKALFFFLITMVCTESIITVGDFNSPYSSRVFPFGLIEKPWLVYDKEENKNKTPLSIKCTVSYLTDSHSLPRPWLHAGGPRWGDQRRAPKCYLKKRKKKAKWDVGRKRGWAF